MKITNTDKGLIKIDELIDSEGNLIDNDTPDYVDDEIKSDNLTTDDFIIKTRQQGMGPSYMNRNNYSFGSLYELNQIINDVVITTINECSKNNHGK